MKPEQVYEGEVGFDMRNSSGMWGPAIYFAKDASYSHEAQNAGNKSDKFKNDQGEYQILLADVLLGECVSLPANNALRLPP